MSKYINFNDESIPIGKRKQAYVRWAVSKGTDLNTACRQANKKFGFEKKEKILLIIKDWGRSQQNSFRGESEIYDQVDLRKLKDFKYIFWNTCYPNELVYSNYGFKISIDEEHPDITGEKVIALIKNEVERFKKDGYKIMQQQWSP